MYMHMYMPHIHRNHDDTHHNIGVEAGNSGVLSRIRTIKTHLYIYTYIYTYMYMHMYMPHTHHNHTATQHTIGVEVRNNSSSALARQDTNDAKIHCVPCPPFICNPIQIVDPSSSLARCGSLCRIPRTAVLYFQFFL